MREKWPQRTFPIDTPPGRFPCVLERLRGTAARIEEKVRGVPADVLLRRIGETWSAQENIGHLLDLEDLHLGRLDDFIAELPLLRAADMENRKTWEADHNSRSLAEILAAFRTERGRYVERLEQWDPARLETRSMHPRLKVQMRVIDMAFFTAEHDDYHLTRVQELITGRAQ